MKYCGRIAGILTVAMLATALFGCSSSLPSLPKPASLTHASFPPNASGIRVGDEVSAWNPVHITGPDAGTKHCPVCTYLDKPAILVFAKDTANTVSLANRLETLAHQHQSSDLKVFMVITDGSVKGVQQMADANQLQEISICLLDPETRFDDLNAYQITNDPENTIMVYRDYVVQWKRHDVRAAEFEMVESAVSRILQGGTSRQ